MSDRRFDIPGFVRLSMFLVAFCLASACGFVSGGGMARHLIDDTERRNNLEDACIAGNSNACALHETKHGRNSRKW